MLHGRRRRRRRERERERETCNRRRLRFVAERERERESERESRKMEPEAWRQFFDLLLMKYSYIIDDEVLLMKYSCIPPTESCSTTSPLTVANLKKHVDACGLSKKIELVIVSPLLRTMQTAVGVFGGEGYMDGIDVPPLMVANAGKSSHPAISSLNCPPFIAVELCRERLGVNPCDRRRSISEYKSIFPAIDFSMIESDADILWKPGPREKDEQLAARGMKFLNWLWTRPEKEIAVVTHSAFLVETLSAFGNDCHPSIKSEICKSFNNCELRSLVIVDKGMLGSDSSTTNYPGKIPSGADLPSDVAKEKHPASGVPT